MAGADKETEIKLVADDPAALAGLRDALIGLCVDVRPPVRRSVRDAYLDTEDWRLYRAGVYLRLRETDDGAVLTLKTLEPIRDGLAARVEIEEALPAAPDLPGPAPGEKVASLLRPVIGSAPLQAKLTLQKQGEIFHAVASGGLGLRVNAEVVRVTGAAEGASFAEAELELAAGRARDLVTLGKRLRRRLGLKAGALSKFERAVQVLDLQLPTWAEGEDLRLRRRDRSVDAAYRVLSRHFRRMVRNEPGARLGLDPERLHDMRVATRRLRAALKVFHGALPPTRTASLKKDFGWLATALGSVRDLDVHLSRLEQEATDVPGAAPEALAAYAEHLRRDREKARAAMLRVLDSKRYAVFVERLGRFLAAGPPKRPCGDVAREPVTRVAPQVIRKRLRCLLADGRALTPDSTDEELHALRIRCKRLRYACEFFADLYGSAAVEFAARLTGLQDILGAHQDACVAQETLERYALGLPARSVSDRRAGLSLGRLAAHHAWTALRTRTEFFKAWRRFDKKKLRAPLRKRLKKRTPKG